MTYLPASCIEVLSGFRLKMGTGASVSICQSLSSIDIKHCTNKVGPQPRRVFGIHLDRFTQDEVHHNVPLVVKHMVDYLEEFGLNRKGLFRISGSARKIHTLKWKFDQGEEVDLVKEGDVDSIASLLKLFLNELPDAVFPESLCGNVFDSSEDNINHMAECTGCLKGLLNSLPKAHYSLFHFLIRFLVKVASHSAVNHMTLENLAIVFGPTFFRVPFNSSAAEKQMLCNSILLNFLQQHEELFMDYHESNFSMTEEEKLQNVFTHLPQGLMHEEEERNHPDSMQTPNQD